MSSNTERKHQLSALTMRTYPHMDGCPCADQGRHFDVTPQYQEYLALRGQRGNQRVKSSED